MIPTVHPSVLSNHNIWLKIRPRLFAHTVQPYVTVWKLTQMGAGNAEIDENAEKYF